MSLMRALSFVCWYWSSSHQVLCISARINSCATKDEKQKQLKLVPLSLCRHLVIVATEPLPSEGRRKPSRQELPAVSIKKYLGPEETGDEKEENRRHSPTHKTSERQRKRSGLTLLNCLPALDQIT
jgi:hypothetical protein